MPQRVLFVCLGNICRSPAAEGVLRGLAAKAGLAAPLVIDSAGTGGWHAGSLADPRMRRAASRRGYELTHRARQFQVGDFERFDWIITMDAANRRDVLALAPDETARAKVRPFGSWTGRPAEEVPDPYYGGDEGFERVLDLLEEGCRRFLAELRASTPSTGV